MLSLCVKVKLWDDAVRDLDNDSETMNVEEGSHTISRLISKCNGESLKALKVMAITMAVQKQK